MAARRPHTQSSPVHTSAPNSADVPTFSELGLPAPLVTALTRLGITTPFPIQVATLPDSLAGRDVLGRGRTGSGKTYAFVLPCSRASPRTPSRAPAVAPVR